MPKIITESEIEQAALDILSELGYAVVNGPEIAPAPDGTRPERERYSDVVLLGRLRRQIERLNPKAPAEVREEAVRAVLRSESQKLTANNEAFHRILTEGISLECWRKDGSTGWETSRLSPAPGYTLVQAQGRKHWLGDCQAC